LTARNGSARSLLATPRVADDISATTRKPRVRHSEDFYPLRVVAAPRAAEQPRVSLAAAAVQARRGPARPEGAIV